MAVKIVGALLVLMGTGGIGYLKCQGYRREISAIGELVTALDWMGWELQDKLLPVQCLCQSAAEHCNGKVQKVLISLGQELENRIAPDVLCCMEIAIKRVDGIPPATKAHLIQLGRCLGKMDLQGQLSSLEGLKVGCEKDLEFLERNRQLRLRNYQTLGFCGGVALVVLFI